MTLNDISDISYQFMIAITTLFRPNTVIGVIGSMRKLLNLPALFCCRLDPSLLRTRRM